jgi:hypothetical protein
MRAEVTLLGDDAKRLLDAIPASHQARARQLLIDPRGGGRGLRTWLQLLETSLAELPTELPAELIDVYLRDTEAEPLHDCESCGLPIPVKVGWRAGHEPTEDRVYFPVCPHCGGRTGYHAYWARPRPSQN